MEKGIQQHRIFFAGVSLGGATRVGNSYAGTNYVRTWTSAATKEQRRDPHHTHHEETRGSTICTIELNERLRRSVFIVPGRKKGSNSESGKFIRGVDHSA